jgi:hypothetical protein
VGDSIRALTVLAALVMTSAAVYGSELLAQARWPVHRASWASAPEMTATPKPRRWRSGAAARPARREQAPRWLLPAWSAGAAAVVVGVASLVFPRQVEAVGSVWAVTAMVWGAAVITVAHAQRRARGRIDRAAG